MISIQNLTKRYGSSPAVDSLSLEIRQGEILGLLGPNGAGKSTTLRVITGYLRPTAGTVVVDGLDVVKQSREVKELIGYLPESAPLYEEMLVYDYLDYIAEARGITGEAKMKRLRELAGLCGIREVMHKPVSHLSKGYRQRVGLALALMKDPPILILDEPTSGLDPNQIAEIRAIIKEIGKEKTIIFSTHILSEAEATCDRVVIINQGRIVADGSADSLKASLAAERTLRITLKDAPAREVESELSCLSGVLALSVSGEDEVRAEIKSTADLREAVFRTAAGHNWVLLEMVQEKESLETIFRELTREGKNES